jgi:hypothetical protein
LKCYDGGGENGITSKRIFLKLKYFSPLRILTSTLFEETLQAFLFLPLFFFLLYFSIIFSLFFFYASSLEDMGFLMMFEEKNHVFKNFLFKWNGMVMSVDILRWTHILEWGYAHQYSKTMIVEMWALWIYRRWMHIPEWRYALQYF